MFKIFDIKSLFKRINFVIWFIFLQIWIIFRKNSSCNFSHNFKKIYFSITLSHIYFHICNLIKMIVIWFKSWKSYFLNLKHKKGRLRPVYGSEFGRSGRYRAARSASIWRPRCLLKISKKNFSVSFAFFHSYCRQLYKNILMNKFQMFRGTRVLLSRKRSKTDFVIAKKINGRLVKVYAENVDEIPNTARCK